MTGWWRANRWWLLALPVSLVAMAVSSGYLLHDFWWTSEPRRAIASAGTGDAVSVTGEVTDGLGTTTHTFTVRLESIDEDDSVVLDSLDSEPERPVPDGADSLRVHLAWEAAPDQLMRGCTVALVDSEGRRYTNVDQNSPEQCVPEDRGGPALAFSSTGSREVPEGEDRPPTWSTEPQFLVPHGVRITQVLVWWQLPDHVRLDVS